MKKYITAIVNTFNEQTHIEECILSLKNLTDRIIVVDSGSTDQTVTIAKKLGADVRIVHRFKYVEQIRQMSIDLVPTGWIIILDADERMTKELAAEIQSTISHQLSDFNTTKNDLKPTHYAIPRKNIFNNAHWLKHGGWWPDYQIRLFEKKSLNDWPDHIHSTPKFSGAIGYLIHPIQHFIISSLEGMVQKTLLFEDIESDLLFKANKKVSTFTFLRKFLGELYRRLIKHRGFLDGTVGIIESIYQAYSKTITYLFLYEKQHAKDTKKSSSL